MNTPLDLALSYTSLNWPVFPCRAKEEIDNHTGEVFGPKTPYTSNGFKSATKTERIVREWWRRTPDAMIGVPTGKPIGAFVLDLDIKPGVGDGHEWLDEMEARHGALPDTARAKTMGGGTHIFFRHVDGIANKGGLGSCVDIRGDGGYIIAPGSQAADGREYEWLEGCGPENIAEAPEWLITLLMPPTITHQPAQPFSYVPGKNEPYIERAVEDELRKLASTGKGGRGSQLNASAFSLGQLVGAGAMSRAEAEDGLFNAARSCGVLQKDGDRETRAKIKRGLDAGMQQPRQIPERQSDNDNTRLVDISRMIANGLAKGKKSGGEGNNHEREQSTEEQQEKPEMLPNGNAGPIIATQFVWKNPKTLPRREFVYGTHYIRKFVSVTSSPGGIGKTSNSIAEALAMCTGRPLLGIKPPKQLKCWLFNAEDPRDEMERRVMAACIHYNISAEQLGSGLFVDTGREQELVIAREERNGVKIIEPVVEAIVAQIQQYGIDVMIIDPFVSTHGVNENDNGAIDKVAKLWAQIADRTNCAIDVVHHIKKVGDREATVEDSRGAGALLAAARSARVLNRMSEDQATDAGISRDERFEYFGIGYGKANLSKLSGKVEWRQLVSVPLGNGSGLTKPQDFAGVVTEWRWPGSEEIAGEVTDEQMLEIARLVDNGQYKEGNRAKDWAGKAVAYALGLDVEEEAGRRRAGTLLKALLKEGKLVKSDEKDPVRRDRATFIRSCEFAERNAA